MIIPMNQKRLGVCSMKNKYKIKNGLIPREHPCIIIIFQYRFTVIKLGSKWYLDVINCGSSLHIIKISHGEIETILLLLLQKKTCPVENCRH